MSKKLTFDDDDDLKPTATATATATAVATTASASTADDYTSELEVEWGDEATIKSSTGLQRCVPDKGEKARFALIPKLKPIQARVHFSKSTGYVRCLGKNGAPGPCCQYFDNSPSLYTAALVLRYTNANAEGALKKAADGTQLPIKWEIQGIRVSPRNFADISTLPEEVSSPYKCDYVVSRKGGKAIGYDYTVVSTVAKWTKNPELVKEVEEAVSNMLDQDGRCKELGKLLGRRLTEQQIVAKIQGDAASNADAKKVNLDDLEDV